MDSSITAYFGGDTSGLRNATQEASVMMKGFSTQAARAVSEIGQGFVGAVVFMEAIKGIKDLASAAMDAAEQERTAFETTGKAISDQGQAWLDLKAGATSVGGGIKSVLIDVVSVFPMLGEGVGGFINDMRGISPEAQKQYQDMENTAEGTIARIQAAHDKFLQELPKMQAAANAKLEALDTEYANSQEDSTDKVTQLTDKYNDILAQIVSTNQVISAQEAAGVDTSATKLKLTQENIDLMQTALALQKAQTQATQDEISAAKDKFNTAKDTMTVEQQITALKAQEAVYLEQEKNDTNTAAQNKLLANAAAQVAVELAKTEDSYRKSISLSVEDQLAMFRFQTGTQTENNAITEDQYHLLVLQSQEKKNQVDLDQALQVYETTLSASDKARVEALQKQNDTLTAQIAIEKEVIANTPPPPGSTPTPTPGGGPKGIVPATQEQIDNSNGTTISGGVPGLFDQYNDSSQELTYLTDTVSNVKSNLQSMITDLQQQRNRLINQDFNPTAGPQIQAIDAKINQLQQQFNATTLANPLGSQQLGPTPLPNSQANMQNLQTISDTLTGINGTLANLLTPSKG